MTDASCLGEMDFEGGRCPGFTYAYAVAGVSSFNTLYADPATRLPGPGGAPGPGGRGPPPPRAPPPPAPPGAPNPPRGVAAGA